MRRVAVSVLLVAVACGARTGLLAPSDASAPVEAGPPLPDGAAVVRGTCTSQLQPGAPTTMSWSTRPGWQQMMSLFLAQ